MHPAVESVKDWVHVLQAKSPWSFEEGLRGFGILCFGLIVISLIRLVVSNLTSPLRHIPGPPNPSWLFGNYLDVFWAEPCALHEKWLDEYGDTFKYKLLWGVRPVLFVR